MSNSLLIGKHRTIPLDPLMTQCASTVYALRYEMTVESAILNLKIDLRWGEAFAPQRPFFNTRSQRECFALTVAVVRIGL
jgi:hypothetical protein